MAQRLDGQHRQARVAVWSRPATGSASVMCGYWQDVDDAVQTQQYYEFERGMIATIEYRGLEQVRHSAIDRIMRILSELSPDEQATVLHYVNCAREA